MVDGIWTDGLGYTACRSLESDPDHHHQHMSKKLPSITCSRRLSAGYLQTGASPASYLSAPHHANTAALSELGQGAFERNHFRDSIKLFQHLLVANTTAVPLPLVAKSVYSLIRSHIAVGELGLARQWTDQYYRDTPAPQAEPAYHLCRALREDGQNEAAFYYYLLATRAPAPSSSSEGYLPVEPEIHEYLLDYEKSILWSYIGDIGDLYSRLHGLSFCHAHAGQATPAQLHSRLRV